MRERNELSSEVEESKGMPDRLPTRDLGADPVVERAVRRAVPLSYAQRAIWFFEQWQPGTPTYNVGSAFWVDGDVDVPALRDALRIVVGRHDSLHSAYMTRNGEPCQVPIPDAEAAFTERDFSALDHREAENAALAEAQEEVRRPFDLSAGCPMRVVLTRAAEHRWLLVLTVHHIAFDGASLDVFLGDLDLAYRKAAGSETAGPSGLAPGYHEYA
ncbi:condensation domain-containing protein, partial [Amycolatopsis lurida]|uniref:condensation domain-containing protein n=1 Tax=Amycolatopsis lurida TaxID=31959 RepID=UPI003665BDC4